MGSGPAFAPSADPSRARHRDHRFATLLVGTSAAAAIVAGLLLLLSAGTAPTNSVLDTMPVGTAAITQCCRLAAALAATDESAMVSLEASGKSPTGCGVVLGDGRLLATTTSALHGARAVRAVTITGQQLNATLVATDPGSGVALLRLSSPLQVAPVDQVETVSAGSPAMAMSMSMSTAGGHRRPRAVWTSGTVVSVGNPIGGPLASGMAAITVDGPSVPAMPGEILVGGRGGVVGILAGASGGQRSFLPMQLVVGVSSELETMGRVRHGWLDLSDTTDTGAPGAEVQAVEPTGASADMLRAGDVIVSVDGTPVASSAELRSLLYVLPPGTKVAMEVLRQSRLLSTVVELSASP